MGLNAPEILIGGIYEVNPKIDGVQCP